MKLNIVHLVVLLNSCFGVEFLKFESNDSTVVATSSNFTASNDNNHKPTFGMNVIGNKLKFIDLNSDVLLQIMNELNFNALLNLAKALPKCAHLIDDTFRRSYKDYTVKIMKSDPWKSDKFESINVKRFNKCIQVRDFEAAQDIIKHFGHVIYRLEIANHDILSAESTAINQLVNKHCDTFKFWLHRRRHSATVYKFI